LELQADLIVRIRNIVAVEPKKRGNAPRAVKMFFSEKPVLEGLKRTRDFKGGVQEKGGTAKSGLYSREVLEGQRVGEKSLFQRLR